MSYIYHNLLTINALHLMNVTKSSARLSEYNRSIVLYADNPVLGRTFTSLAGYVIWYSFPVSWLVGDGCTGNMVHRKSSAPTKELT